MKSIFVGKKLLNSEEFWNGYKLRNIEKMNYINDGNRSLFESVVSNEVLLALEDWNDYNTSDCVLIGGVALSYYVKPRMTQDIDILYSTADAIPDKVEKFKRTRLSAFQHNKTHVEVELLTPSFINTSIELVQAVFDTSVMSNGIKVASPSGLVALKLGRFKIQDQADIVALQNCTTIDLTPFGLSQELLDKFKGLENMI